MATTKSARLAKRIAAVRSAGPASFVQLVAIAGLDRSKAFRFADLSGVDLRGQDLRGFDFTGADLRASFLEGASFAGAVTKDARFDADFQPGSSDGWIEDLNRLSDAELADLLMQHEFQSATDIYRQLDRIDRSRPALLAVLVRAAPDQTHAIAAIRTFFQPVWNGPRAYPIVKRLMADDSSPWMLEEALAVMDYEPADSRQLGALLKIAKSFQAAKLVHQRFERFCSEEHPMLVGRLARSPQDYLDLHELAGKFATGWDQDLMALRALPTTTMVRSALERHVAPEVAALPMVQLILAEKVRRAEEALELFSHEGVSDRPLIRMVHAAMEALTSKEAYRLMAALSEDEAPMRVGGDIRTALVLTLYLKRSDVGWRLAIFNEHLQWWLGLDDLRSRSIQKKLKLRNLVELATMFSSVLDFDLDKELSHLTRSRSDEDVLVSGIRASQLSAGNGPSQAIEAYRAGLSNVRAATLNARD